MTATLVLTLGLPAHPLRREAPTPVQLVLRNAGDDPTVVNTRLAPGYRDSLSREVYFDLAPAEAGPPPQHLVKYQRDFAPPEAYRALEPGEQLTTEVDLLHWYHVPGPGRYRVTAYYQADEPLATPPPSTTTGVVESPTYEIIVQ